MKQWKKVLGVGVLLGAVYIGTSVSASSTSLGSAQDPLITKSYLEEQLSKLRAEFSGKPVQTAPAPAPTPAPIPVTPSVTGERTLVVEELQAGQTLIAGEGTELILRGGRAIVITNQYGDGLPDLTAGVDLRGAEAPYNHLLLVPRNDGRGLKVIEGPCYIMIRGTYVIQ